MKSYTIDDGILRKEKIFPDLKKIYFTYLNAGQQAKALSRFLQNLGFESDRHKHRLGSWYVKARKTIGTTEIAIEIRVSNHTKAFYTRTGNSEEIIEEYYSDVDAEFMKWKSKCGTYNVVLETEIVTTDRIEFVKNLITEELKNHK